MNNKGKRRSNFIKGVSNRRFLVCSGALSLWFAATVLITLFNRYEQVAAKIPFAPIGDVFFCIIVFAFIWAIVVLIIKYFQRFIFWCEKKSRQKPRNNALCQLIAKIDLEFNRKSVLVAALVIVIFWTPWIVLSYPTVVAYDTMNQIYQFQTSAPTYYSTTQVFVDAEYIDHHPVFLSLVYGSVLWVGDQIGSQSVAAFIFCLSQTLMLAIVLACSICYLSKLGVPRLFRKILLFFVALFFALPIISMQLLKDSSFAVVYAGFFLCYLIIWKTRGKVLNNWKFFVLFAIFALLCCLTRKTGIYVIAISLVILIFALKKCKLRAAATVAICACMVWVIMPNVVYPAIGGVEKGTSQEFFGMFYQQVTAVANSCDDLSQEEKDNVNKVFDLDKAKQKFKKTITDPVKNTARRDVALNEQLSFMQSWFTIGFRHLDVYFSTTMAINSPMLSPGLPITFYAENGNEFFDVAKKAGAEGVFHVTVEKPEPIKTTYESFSSAYKTSVSSPYNIIAVILLHRGMWTSWYVAAAICMLVMFRKREWVAFVPSIILLLTFIIGPVAAPRYCYPSLFCGPLTLGLLASAFCKSKPAR